MTGDARRVRYEIPRVSACENVTAYTKEQIQQIAAHLRSNQPWHRLYEASGSWRAAGESLELVSSTLRRVSSVLAAGWQAQDAVACQDALRSLEATARHLAQRTREMSIYTEQSARALSSGAERFPHDSPGFFERGFGDRGAWLDERNPLHNGPSEDDYRRALSSLNNDLLMVNTMLPTHVSGEFGAATGRIDDHDDDGADGDDDRDSVSTENRPGGNGVAGVGGGGATAPVLGSVTAAPTGGFSAAGSTPVIGSLEDGSTGGLAGAAGAPPAAGTGASIAPAAAGTAGAAGLPAAGAAGLPAAGAAGLPAARVAGAAGLPAARVAGAAGLPAARAAGLPAGGTVAGRTASAGRSGTGGAGQSGTGAAGRSGAGTGAMPVGAGTGRAAGTPGVIGARRQDGHGSGRDTWLSEDEDLWHDPDAAPSVIE